MKRIILFAFILFAKLLLAQNQEANPEIKRMAEEMVKEMMWGGIIEKGVIKEQPESFLSSMETNVSNTTVSEGELHAVINPVDSNNIVITCSRAGVILNIYRTGNFGASWSKAAINVLPSTPGSTLLGGGDPVLAFDNNGKLYLTWIALYRKPSITDTIFWDTYWASSLDGGQTWVRESKGNDIVTKCRLDNYYNIYDGAMVDKEWVTCDNSGGANNGNVYVSCTQITKNSFGVVCYRKLAADNFFSGVSTKMPNVNAQLCSQDVDKSGNVYTAYRGQWNSTYEQGIFISRSTDGGKSFTGNSEVATLRLPTRSKDQQSKADSIYLVNINLKRLYCNEQVAIDKSNGVYSNNVYVVWNANGVSSKLGNGIDIYFSKSSDGGITWSPPQIINQDIKGIIREQHHPSISVNESGIIVVGWYDRRDDIGNIKADYYVAVSRDGGTTFSEYKITSAPTNFSASLKGTTHVGEYVQVLATKNQIIPVWLDGRNNNSDLDIFIGFLNINNVSTGFEKLAMVTDKVSMEAVYPNPASSYVNISYNLSVELPVRIEVYDILGTRVVTLINDQKQMLGKQALIFDVRRLSKGLYFVKLSAGSEIVEQKIVID